MVNDVKSDEMVERDPKREDSEVGIVEGRLTSGILEGFIVVCRFSRDRGRSEVTRHLKGRHNGGIHDLCFLFNEIFCDV